MAVGNREAPDVVILCVVKDRVRGLVVLAIAAGVVMVAAAPARASCLPPNLTDQIARADVIAYGRVTSVDRGAGTLSFPGPHPL